MPAGRTTRWLQRRCGAKGGDVLKSSISGAVDAIILQMSDFCVVQMREALGRDDPAVPAVRRPEHEVASIPVADQAGYSFCSSCRGPDGQERLDRVRWCYDQPLPVQHSSHGLIKAIR